MNRSLAAIGAVLKKDLLTLWPITAVAVAAPMLKPWYGDLGIVSAIIPPPMLTGLAGVISVFLVFVVVQNDASVSTRHDWLTRPIRRLDMVIAKTLYLLASILIPWLIGNAAALVIVEGAPLGEALLNASGQIALAMLLLPLLALAALTANKIEAIGSLVLVMVAVAVIGYVAERVLGAPAIIGSGRGWYLPWIALAFIAGVSLLVLWLQYARRRTLTARAAVLASFGLAGLMTFVTWSPASAAYKAGLQPALAITDASVCLVEQPLKQDPRNAENRTGPGLTSPYHWRDAEKAHAGKGAKAVVANGYVTGLPTGWTVVVDRLDARYGQGDAAIAPHGGAVMTRAFGPGSIASSWLLSKDEAAIATRPDARLHLDARLTVMKPLKTFRFPADGERHRIPGLGYCGTKSGGRGNSSMVDCLNVWPHPALLTARFANQPAACTVNCGEPDYTPKWAQIPSSARYKPQIIGGAPGEDVIVTIYEQAEQVRRELDIGGPVAPCGPPVGSPAVGGVMSNDRPSVSVTVSTGPKS